MTTDKHVEIRSRDYWVKIVGMLQQNWALVDPAPEADCCTVFFLHDRSGVFDRMEFDSVQQAEFALRCNGFQRFAESGEIRRHLRVPEPPFFETTHPNGPIYSSGRFWR